METHYTSQAPRAARIGFVSLLGLIFSLLAGCNNRIEQNRDTIAAPVAGSLILRRGFGLLSAGFSRFASEQGTYSHCGIIDYDSARGIWIVWHAYQSDELRSDGIIGQPLEQFIAESETYRVYPPCDLPPEALQRMRTYIGERTAEGRYPKRFDLHFDLRDTSTLYCSEFVALAYRATELPAYCTNPTGHSSLIPYPYYTLDDLTRIFNRRQGHICRHNNAN